MNKRIRKQVETVRDTGLVNMFDLRGVRQVAEVMGFTELIEFIDKDRKAYAEFILYGDRQQKEGSDE